MRPVSIALILLACCVLPACGETPAATSDASGSVWVAESPTTKLYLCGTIHLLRKTDFPLSTAYDKAYADSQRLVFELPPGTARDPKLAMKMQESGTFGKGKSLADSLKPETLDNLDAWAKRHGMSAGQLDKFRPWYVAITVSMIEYVALGADPNLGVDHFFEKRADEDHKPGDGLETMDFQLSLFTGLSDDEQRELLEQTMNEVRTLPEVFTKMINSWRDGDADALHQMLFEEAEKYPSLMDKFLTQRNARWIKQLEGYLAGKEHVMVLVGTGHLGGKGGVIDLLKARGYTVSRVEATKAK
jgi:hypothetical protein